MGNLTITYRKTGELKPYPRNARTHSREQIKQIVASIAQFGFTNPVLIGDEADIVAGHGRVEAAKQLGLSEVPTIQLSHLTARQKRAYILADNRLAEKAGWNKEYLSIELQGLIDEGFEVELSGFDTPEIDIILGDAAEAAGDREAPEDKVPPVDVERAVTQTGDLWELGQHRLICGNSRENSVYAALMMGEKANLIITDPPYNVKIDGHVSGLGHIRHREFAMAAGEMSEVEFSDFLRGAFKSLVAHSVDGSIHYVCMDWRHMREILTAGYAEYSELKNVCVWNKTNGGMGTFYRSKHELVFVWKAGTAPHINNFELGQHGRLRTNVWDYAGVNTFRAGRSDELSMHPTVKPVALIVDAMKDCSRRSDVVLDPFCGSGTILIAAEKVGRVARAIEIDPIYVDVAIKRWELYTGKSAILAATAQTFECVAEARRSVVTAIAAA
ncbi:MAG: DNA methyltransferase [Afipia sp.]|nr:DNA methyltransferase [Afipia sp.]